MIEGWNLTETTFSPETNASTEGLFTLGSGYLHIRGSLEEHLNNTPQNETYLRLPANVTSEHFKQRRAKWGTYIPGIYGNHPLLNTELINLPFVLEIVPIVDGERLDMEQNKIQRFERTLHLDTAHLKRTFIWQTQSGKTINFCFERFISAARKNICVQRLTIKSNKDASLTIKSGIDADVRTNGYDHFSSVHFERVQQNRFHSRVITDRGDTVDIHSLMKGETNDWKYNHNNRKASLSSDFSLEPSKPFIFEKRTVFQTNRDFYSEQLSLDGIEHLSFEELFEEHKIIWKKRWANSDIILEGDNQSQLALRVSLYHLLRAYVPDDSRVAIDAKGYAGEAYWGRFFWDIEMYLLPFFLFTNPSKAKTLVEFRIKSLEGARRNAQRYGYSGARYAWESDPEGNECCPNWQYADHEVHITADVVFGLMQYSIATGDSQCLEQAAPVFVETARYWLERIDIIDGEFHLLGVMGPDEYKPITNDNFYTNLLVSYALHLAAQYGEMVGVSKKECAAFAEASEKLPLLKNSKGVYEQCEGFERFAEPNFNTFWKNREETFASNVSQERLYRTKCLKQADVLMGVYLFPERFTQEDLSKAWEYYLPYTTHDSSLSAGIHAILACRLGKAEIAWEFWKKSSGIDINGGSAEGIHIASAGANWQIIVFGFAGVSNSLTSTTLRLNPYLPDQISRIAFPIVWKGIPVYIDVRKNEVTLENRGEKELSACIWEKEIEVKPKNSINIRY